MILFLIRYIYKPALSEDLMNLVSINNKFDLLGGPKTKGGGGGEPDRVGRRRTNTVRWQRQTSIRVAVLSLKGAISMIHQMRLDLFLFYFKKKFLPSIPPD